MSRFHWQNLNEKPNGTHGWGLREGRCWLHFGDYWSKSVRFEWNLWTHFCGVDLEIGDERTTAMVAFPPLAFWFSISTHWKWLWRIVPKKETEYQGKPMLLVDQRECGIRIHGWCLRITPWGRWGEWVEADPWWVRGISIPLNPFEWRHQSTMVRCSDGLWEPRVGSWEHDKAPDNRETFKFSYTYFLKNGTIQNRTATVHVERMSWCPKCLQWTSLFQKSRTYIEVAFDEEVGERTGSWKGGCVGCGWDLRSGETPEAALRRMEKERKFN